MAQADEPEKKDVGVSLAMPATEKQAVEDWMHDNRLRSFSAAVRCMIRFALANGVRPDNEPDLRKKDGK